MGQVCQHREVISLVCHRCGKPVDPDGPAVGESHNWDKEGEWRSRWVPWVADIHGGVPDRLVHPTCFAHEHGVEALMKLITDSEARRR